MSGILAPKIAFVAVRKWVSACESFVCEGILMAALGLKIRFLNITLEKVSIKYQPVLILPCKLN